MAIQVIDGKSEFKIGHGKNSETRYLKCYKDKKLDVFIIDPPGHLDTNGPELDIANALMIYSALIKTSRVVPIIQIPFEAL